MPSDPAALEALAHYTGPLSGTPHPTIADVVVATLKASGVRRIYGLPGDSLNGLTDALRRDGEIDWQHVRHEEAAAFAAAGEAATTGELAVCAASCGPGNLHLINGLFDAQRSRVPVLAHRRAHPARGDRHRLLPGDPPAGAVPRVQRLRRARQRPASSCRGCCSIAMRTAIERRGVAVLVDPRRDLPGPAPRSSPADGRSRPAAPIIRPSDDELARRGRAAQRAPER